MRYKRLYYNVDIHGGGVGFHDLGQGFSRAGTIVLGPILYVPWIVPVNGVGDNFSLGTADQPNLLAPLVFEPAYDTAGLTGAPFPGTVFEVTSSSVWGVTVNTNDYLTGLYEFYLTLWTK